MQLVPKETIMPARIDVTKVAPGAFHAMFGLEEYLRSCGLEAPLLHLVRMRASQLNGCAYCVDMHSRDARSVGEPEQRIWAVAVWREAPFFTPRERAAFELTEAVTLLSETHVPDDVHAAVAQHLGDGEIAALLCLVVTINAWNALSLASRSWSPELPA